MSEINRLLGIAIVSPKKKLIISAPYLAGRMKWRRSRANQSKTNNVLPLLRRLVGGGVYGWMENSNQVSPEVKIYEFIYDDETGDQIGVKFV